MTPQNDLITIPTIEDLTRRTFISGALASALIIACGGDDEEAMPEATTRTITTKYGTYDIPTMPKRVLVMENRIELETAVALGLNPIAAGVEHSFAGGPASWVAPWVRWTPPGDSETFSVLEPDIERLLSLQPDLIFAIDQKLDGDSWSYASLSAVAPVIPVGGQNWREDLLQVAGWLSREEQAQQVIHEYEALRDEIRSRHASRIASARVVFGSIGGSTLSLRDIDQAGPQAQALSDLGGHILPFADPAAVANGYYRISTERIGELQDADAIMLWSGDLPTLNAFVKDNPLWRLLPAVQAGRVVVVRPNNPGFGSVYTVMECLRHWDQVYSTLA